MSLRKRLARWKDDLDRQFSPDPSSNVTLNPTLPISQPARAPQPRAGSHRYGDSTSSIAVERPANAPPVVATPPKACPPACLPGDVQAQTSMPHTLPLDSSTLSALPTAPSQLKRTAWAGLKSLLRVLESKAVVFGPLKQAVSGLNQCIDIYERCAGERNEYAELRATLDLLLNDLCNFIGDSESPTMTSSVNNLCYGVINEIKRVEEKQKLNRIERHIEAIGDSDGVLECYRRIRDHVGRLVLNANLNIWKAIEGMSVAARLDKISNARSAEYNSVQATIVDRGPCTQGTREQELLKLQDWACKPDSGSVCWMNGMAGTGKTTIAYSLCESLRNSSELAASFFCSRQLPECRKVELIFPSIAYQLARFSRPFCCALLRALDADPDMHTRELGIQLEGMIVKPLAETKNALPPNMVVVIDALDECENRNIIGQILGVLLAQTSGSDLPIRFLVSSRPELEIYERMTSHSGVNARLVLHELDAAKVNRDIETYLKNELKDVPLPEARFSALVEQSGVLFIFASTAARYINNGRVFEDYEERLDSILGLSPPSPDEENGIDVLYATILSAAFENTKLTPLNRNQMKTILDAVICAQEPITVDALAGLLKLKSGKQVGGLLRPLYSVLNVSEETKLVLTLHASFPDFMTGPQRSATFWSNPLVVHRRLAEACLRVIQTTNPQFNVCRLESSSMRDGDIPNLNERTRKYISIELFYACRYWMTHLELAERRLDAVIDELVVDFLTLRLLLWMEVLNVKQTMHIGPEVLRSAERWIRDCDCADETIEIAHDAWRFVTLFTGHVVSQSTPHIYVSMLPFWPETGPVAKCYMQWMRGAVEPRGTAMSRRQLAILATWIFDWPTESACYSPNGSVIALGAGNYVCLIHGTTGRDALAPLEHGGTVMSVSFSPDGARLASGSTDNAVRVWNTKTGEMIVGPLKGHARDVLSVCFSPDGTRVVSGSWDKTIRIWDTKSGDVTLQPLEGHTGGVTSVCFSPDSKRIVSGSYDMTIRVWDTRSGETILGPLEGHTENINSICLSPDGAYIASGSDDTTIRVWDMRSGKPVLDPLRGHSNYVQPVCFSPDGARIASASVDNTIRVWDTRNGRTILGPLEGHTGRVLSVCFSPDGTRILSSSDDKTVRVWDAMLSREVSLRPLEGHTEEISSVCFSPDGMHVASASNDTTIRFWSTSTGENAHAPLKRHADNVNAVCFSPDGVCVASGSDDDTVELWSLQSGKAISGPLEGHAGSIQSVCFSPDGMFIASGSADNTIRIWDLKSKEMVLGPLEGHDNVVSSVSFSPDGMLIVSGSWDYTIRIWDMQRGETILGPLEGHIEEVNSICVSPDGARIASGSHDGTIRVWDMQSGANILGPLVGHTSSVSSVCFSSDNMRIVSGSWDNTIRVWDMHSGETILGPLRGHTYRISSVSLSPNDELVVSGSWDKTIRVWNVEPSMGLSASKDIQNHVPPRMPTPIWSLNEDGWVVDDQSHLLTWVPHDLWTALLQPRNTLLISPQGSFVLNFGSAKLGREWVECYQPPSYS